VGTRCFAADAPAKWNTVQFKKEDMALVMKEVPDFDFYHIGTEGNPNTFANVNMSQAVEYPATPSGDGSYQFSKLENGLKIVTSDNGGGVSEIGLYVKAGSRWENVSQLGVTHMLELTAFRSTAHLSHLRTVKTLETLGIDAKATAGREQMGYSASVLREYLPVVVPLLIGNVLFPRFLPWEVTAAHELINQSKAMDVDATVSELLVQTAFHNNTLGFPLHAGPQATAHFTPEVMRDFMIAHFSPERMCMVGVNCSHKDLSTWAMRSFVDYNAIPFSKREEPKAKYTGGGHQVSVGGVPNLHFAVGFETGGSAAPSLYAVAVLQAMLGTCMGKLLPGSGMGTRLEALLAKGVDSAAAFHQPFSDSGVFGVYVSAPAAMGTTMPAMIKEVLTKKPDAAELERAKAGAKTAVLTAMGDPATLCEDIATQLLSTSKVSTADEIAAAIEKVTAAEVESAAAAMLKTNPTAVSYGNVSGAPLYADVQTIFKK
jgi:processing peptidase subunit alpha